MNIVITAGGTRERIDAVRAITNDATGRLGSLIAEAAANKLGGKLHTIYYLCGVHSAVPDIKSVPMEVIRIEGTEQLLKEMKLLLTTRDIHAVIHSMAVSDYTVGSVTTVELIAQAAFERAKELRGAATCEKWQKIIMEAVYEQRISASKISSELEHPLLLLQKTPKIISMIKDTSPQTLLIGFKLLSGVSHEKLIETAYGLLQRDRCDYVLANDTETMKNGGHIGYLVDGYGNYQTFTGKEQIAEGIADCLQKRIGGIEK